MVLLEGLNDKGTVIYQIPARLDDLLNLRPLDTSIDDYVITFDIVTETAAIYGYVKSEGEPVAGAAVSYTAVDGSQKQTTTDNSGVFVIYDAQPDISFEITASKAGLIGDAYDITAPKFLATRQDFELSPDTGLPWSYSGTYTQTAQNGCIVSGDFRFDVFDGGSASCGYRPQTDSCRPDFDGYSYYFSVGGTHDDGSFILNDGLKGTYNQFNMSGTRSDGITASADRNF